MSLKIRTTISVREMEELKKSGSLGAKLAKFTTSFLEKYFGAPLLLNIPFGLEETEPELWSAIKTAEKLQQLGIIEKIEKPPKYPDEPHLFRIFATVQNNPHAGSGGDFFSEETAFWKAIGEAVERRLWHASDNLLNNIIYSSYEKIKDRAVDIFALAGFSEKQKELSNLKFDKNTIFGWVKAVSLDKAQGRKEVLCPAQLVQASYFQKNVTRQETIKEPMLRQIITTGAAVAPSLEEALIKGILEIIERDAYIISYLNKISPPVIDFEYLSFQDEELEKIFLAFKRYSLEVYLVKLPTDFSVNVVSAVILDKTGKGPAFVIGHSANFNLKKAILGALSEALCIRLGLKKNWDEKRKMELPKPNHFKKMDRVIYWARPENFSRLAFMVQGEKIKIDLAEETNIFENKKMEDREYHKKKLESLRKELREHLYPACYVDLSRNDFHSLGLYCVQVVIPNLQPVHLNEKTPCLGGKRLKEVPRKLGRTPTQTLNLEPHPFG